MFYDLISVMAYDTPPSPSTLDVYSLSPFPSSTHPANEQKGFLYSVCSATLHLAKFAYYAYVRTIHILNITWRYNINSK